MHHAMPPRTLTALAVVLLTAAAPWAAAAVEPPFAACERGASRALAVATPTPLVLEEPKMTPLPSRPPAPLPQAKSCAALPPIQPYNCVQCNNYCTQIPSCEPYCVNYGWQDNYCECVFVDP